MTEIVQEVPVVQIKSQKIFEEICALEEEIGKLQTFFNEEFEKDDYFLSAKESAKDKKAIMSERKNLIYIKFKDEYRKILELKNGLKTERGYLKEMCLVALKEKKQLSLFDKFRVEWVPEFDLKLIVKNKKK